MAEIKMGLIGCGTRGVSHLLSLQGSRFAHVVAVADLYDGHLQRAREITAANSASPPQLFTRDYRQLLGLADLDAVILAVPDFWQERIFNAAVAAGKPVYCEAPFGQSISAGETMLAAAKKSGVAVQVGSGVPSSVACQRAREVVADGRLGDIYLVDIVRDIGTSLGSWRAPYPPDASPGSIDWDAYQQAADHTQPFDLPRFFDWRCYWDYGSGVAGDALIDSLTAVQWIMNSAAPISVMAGGGNYRWRDGRETPDIFHAEFAYPSFALHLSCAMTTSARGHKLSICGSSATLVLEDSRGSGFDSLRVLPEPEAEPYVSAVAAWAELPRQWYYMMNGLDASGRPSSGLPVTLVEENWNNVTDRDGSVNADEDSLLSRHLGVFLAAVLGRRQVNEPVTLGFEAAKLAHLADDAYRYAPGKNITAR
ncbi:MAG: Gfo/Idh/MocA family oxidoreductase [Candidatus Acidiferrales bacterium]